MSERDHTRALRPYLGSVQRPEALLRLHAPHPYAATVTVTALDLAGYEHTRFEVATSWLGPPLPGAPPATGPVHANDTLLLDELEAAKRVARQAHEQLSRGQIPDLWELSGQVRKPAK